MPKFLSLPLLALLLTAAGDPPLTPPAPCPAPAAAEEEDASRIVGGDPAKWGDAPWQVSVGYAGPLINARVAPGARAAPMGQRAHFCGGSLIAPNWVLTAGHCVVVDGRVVVAPGLLLVRYGGLRTGEPMPEARVKRVVLHPDYLTSPSQNDVALLELATPVKPVTVAGVKRVAFVGLAGDPGAPVLPPVMAGLRVSGWGKLASSDRAMAPDLQIISIDGLSQGACRAKWPDLLDVELCAGGGDKDSCQGDSGGPMVWQDADDRWWQVGVVSRGGKCGTKGLPGIYARVSSFQPWIRAQTGPAVR
ncbi:S1 family serine peptidase [Sandaracinobacteroides saxicola]|uniref:Serine protease n=1 Tax=Sandaracinobacteroides saxicola TaxID=2759707 RepID=A0A7G5IFQ2_9SPHN|nr:serine protease [Sandaracinobacteroides saxicola]QMW22194.1 serine protease [Sandaracinobacteroides saxicola]